MGSMKNEEDGIFLCRKLPTSTSKLELQEGVVYAK